MNKFKSGFVAIVGRPNVGKSTFMNQVLAEKVSIISPKPQTTRNQIRGIYTTDSEQIIFIDTPGVHKAKNKLGEFMNQESLSTINDVDLVLWIIDGTMDFGRGDEFLLDEFRKFKTPIYLVVNKIDLIKDKNRLMENIVKFIENFSFDEVFYISALNGENIDKLLNSISAKLIEGPMYYPKDAVSDHPEYFIISEIIREKVLLLTKEEVPHSIAVVLDSLGVDVDNPEILNIRATIYCERASQKKIIIGADGKMIKEIGTKSRKDLLKILGQKMFLDLWVKVEKDWRNKKPQLKKFGYE